MNDIKVAPGTFWYPIQIGLWSNAFNPHSFSDKSVHCCVITIGGREGDYSGRCSKPYWLGPAQNSTNEVEKYLVKELNMLGTGYINDGPFLVYHHNGGTQHAVLRSYSSEISESSRLT